MRNSFEYPVGIPGCSNINATRRFESLRYRFDYSNGSWQIVKICTSLSSSSMQQYSYSTRLAMQSGRPAWQGGQAL
jgi:hypothetical protein